MLRNVFGVRRCHHCRVADNISGLRLEVTEHVQIAKGSKLVSESRRNLSRDFLLDLIHGSIRCLVRLGLRVSLQRFVGDADFAVFGSKSVLHVLCPLAAAQTFIELFHELVYSPDTDRRIA